MLELHEIEELHGRYPAVRQSYNILRLARRSVNGLFRALEEADAARRNGNGSRKGRPSSIEVDILRSAIVMTSAGLDAVMATLVSGAGKALIFSGHQDAVKGFRRYVSEQLGSPSGPFRKAMMDEDMRAGLIGLYLSEKVRGSFQGSGDISDRVIDLLGLNCSEVLKRQVAGLTEFFEARNKIVHDMDLCDPSGKSLKRNSRSRSLVFDECQRVFDVMEALVLSAHQEIYGQRP